MWERDASLEERVQQAWEDTGTKGDLGTVYSALKEVLQALKKWSSNQFGSVRKELENLKEPVGPTAGCRYGYLRN